MFGCPLLGEPFWTDLGIGDVAWYLTGPTSPDLNCDGELDWENIQPGSTVTGEFNVENSGDPCSDLNWEIESWPEWGDWTFIPASGQNLTPEHGAIPVAVIVVTPEDENTEFIGEVKVVNSENLSDFCSVPVYLQTSYESPFMLLNLQFSGMR